MEPNNDGATAASSVVTTTEDASQNLPKPASAPTCGGAGGGGNYRILEITLISAQDLAPVYKSLKTYALIWIHPNRKRTTAVDQQGNTNPTWNNKFSFKVDEEFLFSDESAVNVEIYTISWFRDVLVGTASVQISNLVSPLQGKGKRFVALQIRRPSGSPQGMLNVEVAVLDSTSRSMPLGDLMSTLPLYKKDLEACEVTEDEETQRINAKIQQWRRSMSVDMSDLNYEEFPGKSGSIYNGSMLSGSEICSDVGPSASIVAMEIAKKSWQANAPKKEVMERGIGGSMVLPVDCTVATSTERRRRGAEISGHGRRNSDSGVYSCFVYGFQFTIVCGGNNSNRNTSRHNGNHPVKSKSNKPISDNSD